MKTINTMAELDRWLARKFKQIRDEKMKTGIKTPSFDSLKRAMDRMKQRARERQKPMFVIRSNRYGYRVTGKAPKSQTEIVSWSNRGE